MKPMTNVARCMSSLPSCSQDFDDATKEALHENCGMYSRVLHIPEGAMLLGKEHAVWGLNILASGSILLMNDPYGEYVRIDAPQVFESGPGSQKLFKALTDCVFINVMNTEENETIGDVMKRIIKEPEWQPVG